MHTCIVIMISRCHDHVLSSYIVKVTVELYEGGLFGRVEKCEIPEFLLAIHGRIC